MKEGHLHSPPTSSSPPFISNNNSTFSPIKSNTINPIQSITETQSQSLLPPLVSTSSALTLNPSSNPDYDLALEYLKDSNNLSDELIINKLKSIRYIKTFLKSYNENDQIYEKIYINQLILDNILLIIFNEERKRGKGLRQDAYRKQILRVELYSILSELLESSSLFGANLAETIEQKISVLQEDSMNTDQSNQSNSLSSVKSLTNLKKKKIKRSNKNHSSLLENALNESSISPEESKELMMSRSMVLLNSNKQDLSQEPINHSDLSIPPIKSIIPSIYDHNLLSLTLKIKTKKEKDKENSSIIRTSSAPSSESVYLQNVSSEFTPSRISSSKLKPRATILFNETANVERLVPGTDPLNFIETDRKLGYQKPRMWFPSAELQLKNRENMLNLNEFNLKNLKISDSDQIVEQYLRMKALASYVGDLIVPYAEGNDENEWLNVFMNDYNEQKKDPNKVSSFSNNLSSNLTDNKRYQQSLKETLNIWNPIVKTHLPIPPPFHSSTSKIRNSFKSYRVQNFSNFPNQLDSLENENENASNYFSINPSKEREYYEEEINFSSTKTELMSPEHYFDSRKQENFAQTETFNEIDEKSLKLQSLSIDKSIKSLHKSIHQIIDYQSTQFIPRYLLILEGNRAKERVLLKKLLSFFIKNKIKNLLSYSMGLWKVFVLELKNKEKRPEYAKNASCHLILNWLKRQRYKNSLHWFSSWKKKISIHILLERNNAIIRIQSFYRRIRDKHVVIRKFLQKPYLGFFSDIMLEAPRDPNLVKFQIPPIIRKIRRIFWHAAQFIQKIYRGWIENKIYYSRKKKIILIQSLIRMFPIHRKYLRFRAKAIQCQARARAMIKRRAFVRVRSAALIIQKYGRRLIKQGEKLRELRKIYTEISIKFIAALKIQQRFYIWKSKKTLKSLKDLKLLKIKSALTIQRNWYRYKGEFSMYFLLRSYRTRELYDISIEDIATIRGRLHSAKVIQKYFSYRYKHIIIENIIRVQCWYRGRIGFFIGKRLRREKWASRKLRNWAKIWCLRRNKNARIIQNWWWRLKSMRLLKNLWYRKRLLEKQMQENLEKRQYLASSLIQAFLRGLWTRRYIKKIKAIIFIQKFYKKYFKRKKQKKKKKILIKNFIKNYVNNFVSIAIDNNKKRMLLIFEQKAKIIQAIMLGNYIRKVVSKNIFYSEKVAKSVLYIQRLWRNSRHIFLAMELKRKMLEQEQNPFHNCQTFNQVISIFNRKIQNIYSINDPRVGMKVSIFLYRIGMLELIEILPVNKYQFVFDLKEVTVEMLRDWWIANQAKKVAKLIEENPSEEKNLRRIKPPPTALFQRVIDYINIPINSKKIEDQEKLNYLKSISEFNSPIKTIKLVRKIYEKQFGKQTKTRALNFAKELTEYSFRGFSGIKTIGPVLTAGQIERLYFIPHESSQFLSMLEDVRLNRPSNSTVINVFNDESQYEIKRSKELVNLYQNAIEKILEILEPNGNLYKLFEKNLSLIYSYKRKILLNHEKLKKNLKISKRNIAKTNEKTFLSPQEIISNEVFSLASIFRYKSPLPFPPGFSSNPAVNPPQEDYPLNKLFHNIPLSQIDYTFKPQDYFHFSYCEQDILGLELDKNLSIIKAIGPFFYPYTFISNGISQFIRLWRNYNFKRKIFMKQQEASKLAIKSSYVESRHENKVIKIWQKIRKKELIKKKILLINEKVQLRKKYILHSLEQIPRYGFIVNSDSNGYFYYQDARGNVIYDMPQYSFNQWIKVEIIQKLLKKFYVKLKKRKELKRILISGERSLNQQLFNDSFFSKYYYLRLYYQILLMNKFDKKIILKNLLNSINKKLFSYTQIFQLKKLKKNFPFLLSKKNQEIEKMIPYKYQISPLSYFINNSWAILLTESDKLDPFTQEPILIYDLVMIFRIRLGISLCDVRFVKGNIIKNVSLERIYQMNYTVGMPCESRYRRRKMFYSGKISKIRYKFEKHFYGNNFLNSESFIDSKIPNKSDYDLSMSLTTVRTPHPSSKLYYSYTRVELYDILYDDNDIENSLQKEFVRPSKDYFLLWLKERREEVVKICKYLRRKEYIKNNFSSYRPLSITSVSSPFRQDSDNSKSSDIKHPYPPNINTSSIIINNLILKKLSNISFDHFYEEPDEVLSIITNDEDQYKRDYDFDNEDNDLLQQEEKASPTILSSRPTMRLSHSPGRKPDQNPMNKLSTNNIKFILKQLDNLNNCKENNSESDLKSFKFSLNFQYNKFPLKFGWEILEIGYNSIDRCLYNHLSKEILPIDSSNWPIYSFEQDFAAIRIQLSWKIYKARLEKKKRIFQLSPLNLSEEAIFIGSKVAWIGYKFEGLTWQMVLNRSGFFELVEYIEEIFRLAKKPVPDWEIEWLSTVSKEEIDKILNPIYHQASIFMKGNNEDNTDDNQIEWANPMILKDLKDFQNWWKKSTDNERIKNLALFNYFKPENEERENILITINDSLQVFYKKFLKTIKTHPSKTKSSLEEFIVNCTFPHSHRMVDLYLKKYGDKPELARENLREIQNKKTTHTWFDEIKVWKIYERSAILVLSYFNYFIYPLRLVNILKKAYKQARELYNRYIDQNPIIINEKNIKIRVQCPGNEARSAYYLRQHFFLPLILWIKSAEKIQQIFRMYSLQKKWKYFRIIRNEARIKIQLKIRCYLAVKKRNFLRLQYNSPWEQLWDDRYMVMYYFNRYTGISTYTEPPENESFRPLVRHKLTAQLIQAWPSLNETRQNYAAAPFTNPFKPDQDPLNLAGLPTALRCSLCQIRKLARVCIGCSELNSRAYDVSWSPPVPYCVPCYLLYHEKNGPTFQSHIYEIPKAILAGALDDFKESSEVLNSEENSSQTLSHRKTLKCCMCPELATKKCLGILNDQKMDIVLQKLRKTSPRQWFYIFRKEISLNKSKIFSLIKSFLTEFGSNYFDFLQLDTDTFSSLFENYQSNNFVSNQFVSRKDNGNDNPLMRFPEIEKVTDEMKQLLITPITPLQFQVISTVLSRTRSECDECYCESCYETVHGHGMRKNHFWKSFQSGCLVCHVCGESPAEFKCLDCQSGESKDIFEEEGNERMSDNNDIANYCQVCFNVFHAMGKKKKHKKDIIYEKLPEPIVISKRIKIKNLYKYKNNFDQDLDSSSSESDSELSSNTSSDSESDSDAEPKSKKNVDLNKPQKYVTKDIIRPFHYCSFCTRKVGHKCRFNNCHSIGCSECLEFIHKPNCSEALKEASNNEVGNLNNIVLQQNDDDFYNSIQSNSNVELKAIELCVVCGEIADQRCIQCGDPYCSKFWGSDKTASMAMSFISSSCFAQFHSKGNRATHTLEPIFNRDSK